ncbi:hypothetical protein [Kaistia terrae]|uniref:Uncharacterized protein n=1 Tax=Kaistia terrae TaxID=537017 RepID=A0ABW0Q383_9HYPH|nr:hypothetical protein [Kaistia terrae]MCX5581768.1 hypothetical protein [Kaistia terrae]
MIDDLAVYDGRDFIGSTRRRGPHDFLAMGLDGKKLGTFPDQAGAMHAVRVAAQPAASVNSA